MCYCNIDVFNSFGKETRRGIASSNDQKLKYVEHYVNEVCYILF